MNSKFTKINKLVVLYGNVFEINQMTRNK